MYIWPVPTSPCPSLAVPTCTQGSCHTELHILLHCIMFYAWNVFIILPHVIFFALYAWGNAHSSFKSQLKQDLLCEADTVFLFTWIMLYWSTDSWLRIIISNPDLGGNVPIWKDAGLACWGEGNTTPCGRRGRLLWRKYMLLALFIRE